jgi:predicted short-subunit dehydrogenase-like oxidoreductase (DUF2520 family)
MSSPSTPPRARFDADADAAPWPTDCAAPDPAHPILILGAGRVGRTLARWLVERGAPVRIWNRRETAAVATLRAAGMTPSTGALPVDLAQASLVILCVRDQTLPALAGALARPLAGATRPIALHTSGATTAATLSEALPAHVACGALHPVQAFTGARDLRPEGIPASVSGDERARAAARWLAGRLGFRPFALPAGDPALYHAALALLSNGLVGLFAESAAAMEAAGFERATAGAILSHLMDGTSKNLHALSPRDALTGPMRRGDDEVVRRHRDAVARWSEERLPLTDAVNGAIARLLADAEEGAP